MTPFRPRRVVIVGLGLIGGSLALALRKRDPSVFISGVGRTETLASEAARACADQLIANGDDTALAEALGEADLAVLATPVRAIEERLAFVLEHCPLVTDCGSTKRRLVRAVRRPAPTRVRARASTLASHPRPAAPPSPTRRSRSR
jgi:prephenate dehydrogenase